MAYTRKQKTYPLRMANSDSAGLHRWWMRMLEQLGFMVLAKGKGSDQKVATYKKSLQNLIKTMELVQNEYTETDRKRDLAILHKKAIYLYDFVKKNL